MKRKRGRRITTEEECVKYLVKKARKKATKVAKKLKAKTISGYSNDSNPFGDSNLTEKFVWPKKIEKDVAKGVPPEGFSRKADRRRQRESEKAKKQREERALEKARREEDAMMLQRQRAWAQTGDIEKKEKEFELNMSKDRSMIRLREGRAKPIDVLIKYSEILEGESGEVDKELDEPYMVFKGLSVKELEKLHDDIKLHLDLDRATPNHVEYWEALMVVCEWELAEARRKDAVGRARVRGEQPPAKLLVEERGLHSSIKADVRNLLEKRTYKNLVELQSRVESEMRSGKAKVVEYWEALLKRLHIYKAKARLKEIHEKMLSWHLHRLEPHGSELLKPEDEKTEEEEINRKVEDAQAISPEPITEEGSFSPQLYGEETEDAIDPDEDRAILEERCDFFLRARKAMGAMDKGDSVFGSGAEVNLDSQAYWWHDKYRPRKPKYFNRVHTGYEWNKYNRTHYDHDNPPPKIVQGYKFNIFYPDLVDKTKALEYFFDKDGYSTDTCILRFHASPPYEDIAFRIVNRELEYSDKMGFKCTFERGILHMYFNFKRDCYQR